MSAQGHETQDNDNFPWELGVYDAHCHPTDTMSSIEDISQMKATTLTIMATRGEDQELVARTASTSLGKPSDPSVHQGQPRVIPCFGWHPWFSHQVLVDSSRDDAPPPLSASTKSKSPDTTNRSMHRDKTTAHYKSVLFASPGDEIDAQFISSLPDPIPLSQFIAETKARLVEFPTALVGEVGLDRAFRLPVAWSQEDLESRNPVMTPGSREGRTLSPYRVQLSHQKAILEAQLRLAGELHRPVSIHIVQAHGAVYEVLKDLWSGHERKIISRRARQRQDINDESDTESAGSLLPLDQQQDLRHQTGTDGTPIRKQQQPLPFPPRICLHSYSGPVEPLKQFLHPTVPSDVYFSFSDVINFSNPASRKVERVIKALPDDRILIESDLHIAGRQMDDLLQQIALKICHLRGWTVRQGVQQFADNWKRFICG